MHIRDNNVRVIGFKGNVDSINDLLAAISKFNSNDSIIQLLDADGICSIDHVYHGINQALLAFERDENLANDLSVEIILRCSAQRQISKAFDLLGLKEGEINLCGIFINCSNDVIDYLSSIFDVDSSVLLPDNLKLKKIFDIQDNMLESIPMEKIILDKVSKLSVDF